MAIYENQVLIETFPDRNLAEMFAEALRSEGIDSIIQCDDEGGVHPALAMVSGAKLVVAETDAERAREIVASMLSRQVE